MTVDDEVKPVKYENLVQQGLKAVESEVVSSNFEISELDTIESDSSLRTILLTLLCIAGISSAVLLRNSYSNSAKSNTTPDANIVVFADIEASPQATRAKQAAKALASFIFEVDEQVRSIPVNEKQLTLPKATVVKRF